MSNDLKTSVDIDTITDLRAEIVGIDQQVPLLDGTTRTYISLDNAASTPSFQGVHDKVNELLLWYSSIHRGTGFKSILSTHAYEKARNIVARFVGADPQTHCVIFGKNTTEAINKLAARMTFSSEDIVISTVMEHHSNDLPWRPKAQVKYIELQEDGSLDLDDLEKKLDRYKGRVKLVTTTGASNVTGNVTPISEMAEIAHRFGAKILVDCAQLAAHRAIDIGLSNDAQHIGFVAFLRAGYEATWCIV